MSALAMLAVATVPRDASLPAVVIASNPKDAREGTAVDGADRGGDVGNAWSSTSTTDDGADSHDVGRTAPETVPPQQGGGTSVPSPNPSLQPCGGIYPPCAVAERESRGDYSVVSPDGLYHGKWQFLQSTWDAVAARAGRADLVGVAPENATPADQDAMAANLWAGGAGCGNWGACT